MKSTNRAKDAMVKRHWLSAATVLLLTASAVASQQWRRYINGRFGTSADVPADFKVGPAPANDDGRTFTSPDGRATIRIFASYAPSTVTDGAEAYERWLEDQERSDGLTVSYRLRRRRCGLCRPLCRPRALDRLRCDRQRRFDPIVTHLARSLRAGDQSFCR